MKSGIDDPGDDVKFEMLKSPKKMMQEEFRLWD